MLFWQLVTLESLILQIKYCPFTMETLGELGMSNNTKFV